MAKYNPDRAGVAEFLRSPQLARTTERVAESIAKTARANAPRSNDGEGVPYADGIVVERMENAGIRGDRVGYEVIATGGHPTLVEWGRRPGNGNSGYEGQHIMRNAMLEVTQGG